MCSFIETAWSALGTLIKGYLLDGNPIRFALAAVIPFMITLTLVSSNAREGRHGTCPDAFLLDFSLLPKPWWEAL